MSYNKYVLLTIEEHQDLISRIPNEPVDKLLNTPMDSDSKVAHIRAHLSNVVNNRLHGPPTQEEEEQEEKRPQTPAPAPTPVTEVLPETSTIVTEIPPATDTLAPLLRVPQPRTRLPQRNQQVPTANSPPPAPTVIDDQIAKREFLAHIAKHPDIFKVDKATGRMTIHGQPITIHNKNRIAEDFSGESPLQGVQLNLHLLSEELKKTGFPERFILNPKRTRAKWTEELFNVAKIIPYDIPVYVLTDKLDRELDGIWYEEEMVLHVKTDDVYEIEKIIRKRTKNGKKECLVKFKGYDASFNAWIPATDVIDL
ncbi:unnamed protein product [Caenorhabditis brenneri]